MAVPVLAKTKTLRMSTGAFEPPAQGGASVEPVSFEPVSFVSQGPDGSAILARSSDGRLVELRFVASLRADPHRWSELERRCSLLSMRPIAAPSARAIIACDLDGDDPLIALEPAAKDTLAQWLGAQQGLAIEPIRVVRMLEPLAYAVGAAHRLLIVHGALSPETISVTETGLLRVEFTGARCESSHSHWSMACRAPESLRDDAVVDPAADVYALAMIALGMLVGGEPTEEAMRESMGGLPEGLRAILAQALARDPDERPTVAEWTLSLREWMQRCGGSEDGGMLASGGDFERTTSAKRLEPGVQLGRYYLMRMLGEGGMGEVWEAMDLTTSASVAIKVMRPEIAERPELLRRFRKEARTLATVRNPYIANLIEMNEDGDLRYLVMEFVEGPSVAKVLEERGAFDEPTALAIIADACRALIEPHRVGIVHRDLKPDNLMFVRADETRADGVSSRQLIKVCDFGIARQNEPPDRAATQVTQQGMLLGTPAYMAPEQCLGSVDVFPATDVYALGATLFELLSGRVPFEGATPMEVVLAHLSQPVPDLRSIVPGVSEGAAAIVARAMAKEPSERFSDARAMLDAIERVRVGDRDLVAVHPVLPAQREGWTRRFVFEFELDARPEELWPYVSNTDKMNRVAGLAPVTYKLEPVVRGVSERIGMSSALGIPLQWREQPYEWIENKRHAVFREFERGPIQWYAAEVDLCSSPSGRTVVRHTITLHPRNWLGYFASRIEVGFKYRRALAAAYRRLDAMLARARAGALAAGVDPLMPAPSLARGAEQRLESAAAAAAKHVDRAIVDAVCQYLRVASDADVSRMRPYVIADAFGLPRDPVAEACLVLAKEGVLTLLWDVLCPSCRISTSVADSLANVRSHGDCAVCNIDFELDFASSIELVFRPAPTIRTVETKTYCAGGPGHFPHVIAQLRLRPGERFELALSLPAGRYQVRSAQLSTAIELLVRKGAALRRADLALREPLPSSSVVLAEDAQTLSLDNELERDLLVRVERMTLAQQALTAAKASSMQVFREMFPEQRLAPGALVSVASMTLVSTAIADSANLFRAMGDERAYNAALEHFRVIEDVVCRHGGALLKTVGARSVSAFDVPATAVEAAIELRRALASTPSCASLPVKIGVHGGTMMATTIGDRLDYFGRNAEIAFALPEELTRPVTLLTQSVADEPSVRALLIARSLRRTPRRVRSLGLDCWGVEIE